MGNMGRLTSSAHVYGILSLVASTLSSNSPHVASARAISRSFVMTQPGFDFQELASERTASATDSACDDESEKVRDTSYSVLAVIGSQKSGKSTLMNAAFGTTFPVKESAFGESGAETSNRRRKSQSAWLDLWEDNNVSDYRLVLMDMDSAGRNHQLNTNRSLDARTILLALALADVVVLNVKARDFLDQTVGDDEATEYLDPAVLALAFEHFAATTASGAWTSSSNGRDSIRSGGVRGALGKMRRALGGMQRWRPGPLQFLKRHEREARGNHTSIMAPPAVLAVPKKHIAVVIRDVEGGPEGGDAFVKIAAELWRRLCLAAIGSDSLNTGMSKTKSDKELTKTDRSADVASSSDWSQARHLPGGAKWQHACQFTVSFHPLPCGLDSRTSGPISFESSAVELRNSLLGFLETTRSTGIARDDVDLTDSTLGSSNSHRQQMSEMKHEGDTGSVSGESMLPIQPRMPLGEFGLFTEALWDSIVAQNEDQHIGGTSRRSSTTSTTSADLSSSAARRQRGLNLGPIPHASHAIHEQDELSYLGASLANLCLAPLLLQVSALDDKVRTSAAAVDCRTGPPCLEFGPSVWKIMSQADSVMQNLAIEMGLLTVAARVPSTPGTASAASATAATQVAPVVPVAARRLRHDVLRCLEPTMARYLASCAAYALLNFDDEFSSLLCVPGLPCGKGSDFALRADALVADALATFDAAAATVERAPGSQDKMVNRNQRHASSSCSSVRAALLEELQGKVADRRAEGSAFGSASDDEDDEADNSGRTSSGRRALTRRGMRGAWAKLPRRWKVLLSRALPLVVNWVQSMHTLVSRRRAAQRQDAILPVMPLF